MYHRPIAILIAVCFALGTGGCESFFDSFKSNPQSKPEAKPQKKKPKKHYEEVLLPPQTGTTLQRRMYVERGPEEKKTTSTTKKKEKPAPKPTATPEPEASASPTPKPEEESTPAAERFR